MPRKSPFLVHLTKVERTVLEDIAVRYTSPYIDVVRARIILYAAEGMENQKIASKLDLPRQIVSKWRKRFFKERLGGLQSRPRRGRPPIFPPGSDG